MSKFKMWCMPLILFTISPLWGQVSCVQSMYGTHINIFPFAGPHGLTTPVLINDKPEYAAFLQSAEFCNACLGPGNPQGLNCSDFVFDSNITSDTVAACLSNHPHTAFKTRPAHTLTILDFTRVVRKGDDKVCEIRHQVMDFEPCLFLFDSVCKNLKTAGGKVHKCAKEENYYARSNPTATLDGFTVTHKPTMEYILSFYNCPSQVKTYRPNCPTAGNETLSGDCLHTADSD